MTTQTDKTRETIFQFKKYFKDLILNRENLERTSLEFADSKKEKSDKFPMAIPEVDDMIVDFLLNCLKISSQDLKNMLPILPTSSS